MQNAKNLLSFVVALGVAIDKSTEDKKVDWADLPNLMVPLSKAGPAFENVKEAVNEFKNADPAQKAELVQLVKDELSLRSDRTEELIEDSFEIGLRVWSVVDAIRA